MTIQEQIEVMQAFIKGAKIQMRDVNKSVWYNVEQPKWNWDDCEYRVKPEPVLPTTWDEFCETHPLRKGEARLDENFMISDIGEFYGGCKRDVYLNKNILPSRKIAEAMRALSQLLQLRDCYNDGWIPNWGDSSTKHCISYTNNTPVYTTTTFSQKILAFKDAELRREFLKNFQELLEIAKPLL